MYSLLLLNGGVGARANSSQPKQFIKINGIPILVYSLVAADGTEEISEIIINYPDGCRDLVEEIVHDYAIQTPVTYVPAGATRQDSVRLMLEASTATDVLIHESARPMVRPSDFQKLIAHSADNVSLMLPISFTVAPVDPLTSEVTGALDRSRLRNVQLPQKFSAAALRSGHEFATREGLTFTEDATMCVTAGFPVFFTTGDDSNIKVTTPVDVQIAGFILSGGLYSE